MTALKEYVRLESGGLWRADAAAQRRDVVVSFGNATLVIADGAGRPLAHWSLPAVARLNPTETPAIYAPDTEAEELLEIEDDLMIGAIEKVRRSLARDRPRPGRLRHLGIAVTGLLTLAIVVFWLPGALTRQTLTVVPQAKRAEIGATLLGHIQRVTGPTCRDPLGTQALARLKQRVIGADAPGQILVVPGGIAGTLALPGGIVVMNRALIDATEDPSVVAGHVIAAEALREDADPLHRVLRDAGLVTIMRLLTTGDIPVTALQRHADRLVAEDQAMAPDDAVLAGFAAAEVPATPYAYAVDVTGERTRALIDGDPMAGQPPPLILSDSEWISLQGICG